MSTDAERLAELLADPKTLSAYLDNLIDQPGAKATDLRDALLINWPEFWATDHSAEEWIAWPLIPAQRQVALFAPAKTGKSIVTLDTCASVATGRPILGGRPQEPQSVLYLDYEMTAGDLHERLEALGYGPDDDLSLLHYALLPSLPPLNSTEGCKVLCGLAGDVDAKVVVIDTMGRAVEGEENSADSYREFARTTGLALKAAGRAVLRTDHAGKNKDLGQRGSSAKNDDVDVVMRIDVAEGGWLLTRTHTRIAWVPDKVMIERSESADGTLRLTADAGKRTYVEGTRELVAQLRGLGVDATWGRRPTVDLLRNGGYKVSNKRVGDALAWMRAELPIFAPKTTGTTLRTSYPQDRGSGQGTTGTDSRNPRSDNGDHSADHCGPPLGPNGDQAPPLKGGQYPMAVPEVDF